jgi:hypothetical protein
MHTNSHSTDIGTTHTTLALINLPDTPEAEIIKDCEQGRPWTYVPAKRPRTHKINKQQCIKQDKQHNNDRTSGQVYRHHLRLTEPYVELRMAVDKPEFVDSR